MPAPDWPLYLSFYLWVSRDAFAQGGWGAEGWDCRVSKHLLSTAGATLPRAAGGEGCDGHSIFEALGPALFQGMIT